MPYTKINGVKTYYEVHGRKEEWLVLVHAMSMSVNLWKYQIKEFSKHFKVLVYDVRAQGKTESSKGDFSIQLFTKDLKALCDFLEIKKANFLGLSMGGMICQQFALNYPKMVDKLVLCDTYHKVSDEGDKFLFDWTRELTKLSPKFVTFIMNETQFPKEDEWENYNFFKKESEKIPKEVQLKLLDAVEKFDVSGDIEKISMPTLIITGEDEVNFHKYLKDMHEKIKNSEFKIIPKAYHLTNMDNPKEFNKVVIDFLEKN